MDDEGNVDMRGLTTDPDEIMDVMNEPTHDTTLNYEPPPPLQEPKPEPTKEEKF